MQHCLKCIHINYTPPLLFFSVGFDYSPAISTVTILASQFSICFPVEIIRDARLEDVSTFFVELSYSGAANVSVVSPSTITVIVFGECPSLLSEKGGNALKVICAECQRSFWKNFAFWKYFRSLLADFCLA